MPIEGVQALVNYMQEFEREQVDGRSIPQSAPSEASLEAQLVPLRAQIDAIDTQLIRLLNERAAVAQCGGRSEEDIQCPGVSPGARANRSSAVCSR